MNKFAPWQRKARGFTPQGSPRFVIRGHIVQRGVALFEARFVAVPQVAGAVRESECCMRATSAEAAGRLVRQGMRQLADQLIRHGASIEAMEYPDELEHLSA
ncbi:MAG: hypothetical protein ACM3X5_06650 [Bacillota bacterium]